jgi:hypothetical protein
MINTIGEKSIPERVGMTRRIGASSGSTILSKNTRMALYGGRKYERITSTKTIRDNNSKNLEIATSSMVPIDPRVG